MKTRIYFLDNLRTFMILLVIILHASIGYTPFLSNTWIVDDPSKSDTLGLMVIYLDIFVMFIMFYISGYFTPGSYSKRSLIQYIKAKFNRIMIPWAVAVFVLIPVYKMLFLYSRGLPQEEWFSYFHFFAREGGNPAFYADNPAQGWLWFLPVLFLFQVCYAIMAKSGILNIRISLKWAVILTFTLGITYSFSIAALDLNGWYDSGILHFQRERLFVYFLFFLLGSLSYKLKVFEYNRKHPVLLLSSYIILTASLILFTLLSFNYFANMSDPARNQFLTTEALDGMLYYVSVLLSVFGFLYAFLHTFRKHLNHTNTVLSEMSKNSYSVYIIHMIVIGGFSYLLLPVNMPPMIKFVLVSILSILTSNILVSIYRKYSMGIFSKPAFTYVTLIACSILTIAYYGIGNDLKEDKTIESITPKTPEISIHMAAIKGDTLIIRQHLNAGTDPNKSEPSGGSSPLITASLFGNTDVVRILLASGADVNFRNNEGSTALHTASFFGHDTIVKLLLDQGADISIRNASGSTALESVVAPFEYVKGIYEQFQKTLGPLGLKLNYTELQKARVQVCQTLKSYNAEK